MMMGVVKLCIIFFVVAVQGGSKGPVVSPSPAFLPVIHPDGEAPGPVHHGESWGGSAPSSLTNQYGFAISPTPATLPVDPPRSEAPFTFLPRNPWKTISPSTPEVPKEPFLHPPVTLPPTISSVTPHKGVEPSTPPSPSPIIITLSPLYNAAPAPSTAQWNVPPTSAPTPHTIKVIEPSISPSPSPSAVTLSPPYKDVPKPSIAQQNVPPTAAPIPQKIKGIEPSISPSPSPNTITLSPPYKAVPAPSTAPGNVPTTSAPTPPNIKGIEPSVTPRPSPGPITLSPLYKDVPAPSTTQGNVPTTSAPTPPDIKGIEPSVTPRPSPGPITLSPLYKDVPAPSTTQGHVPTTSAPTPPDIKGIEPSVTPRPSPSPIAISPLYKDVPAPSTAQGNVPPFVQPSPPQRKAHAVRSPEYTPTAPAPVVIPSGNFPKASPIRQPSPGNKTLLPATPASSNAQGNAPPYVQPIPPQRKSPAILPPVSTPTASAPVAMPSGNSPKTSPVSKPSTRTITLPPPYEPILAPSIAQGNVPPSIQPSSSQRKAPSVWPPTSTPIAPAPVTSPTSAFPLIAPSVHTFIPAISPSKLPAPVVSPALTPSRKFNWKKGGEPVCPPLDKAPKPLPAAVHSPAQAPAAHKARQSLHAPKPQISSPESPINKEDDVPAISPSTTFSKHNHTRNIIASPAPASTYSISPLTSKHQDQSIHPPLLPLSGRKHHAPSPMDTGSSAPPFALPALSPASQVSPTHAPAPAPAPLFKIFPRQTKIPFHTRKVSPPRSSSTIPETPDLPRIQALPPPPPNEDCITTICSEPYTNSPPGAPCGCVWPMKVGLRFGVSLYTFFPLVSELASEIATGVFMRQSQVRIMGANIASQEPDKTVALIDLVPVGEKFDNTTAFVTSERFWHKKVSIKASYFGDYDVLYVSYPGLPPSPPLPPSSMTIDGGPYSSDGNNGRTIKPLGVDVHKMQQHKAGLSKGIVAIIALSSFLAVVLCSAAVWALFKYRNHVSQAASTPRVLPPPLSKATGTAGSSAGDGFASASSSFRSGVAAYTGSAKTFSLTEIEKATDNFQDSRILGEGGFGRVYSGILEDGTKVAVKVLKREDHHGDREFLAEVEMLSRLHHRNLVKLIGICTEGSFRCLVYELIPNGSVESHLHGANTKNSRFDWSARLKIALGAARGLAYLHEDSSPPVIHRDFKSSNILLEDDFTPKVSDFGLARIASNEGNRHISTRVMGTFGYVAPEYAMTGHLLVKSDVYSYGVVVLELLTGRKPVDMSQPPGQENLVAWARPLLTSKEGLEAIIDPSLGTCVPFDSVAKVAAIASMCVQSDVSDRPFMGEVVQALKLVCNECDEAKESGSKRSSQEYLTDADSNAVSGHHPDNFLCEFDIEKGLPASELFSSSSRFGRQASGSFRRQSYSGPLRTGRRSRRLWQIIRTLSGGSVSEHGIMFRL